MPFDWKFFRDQIVLGDDLAKEMVKEINYRNIPSGSTLLLTARDFKLSPGYIFNFTTSDPSLKFPGRYHLVLLADRFDAQGGSIDVSGERGKDGVVGPVGQDFKISDSGGYLSGGAGGKGENGTQGTNGMNVTLFCRDLVNANIISNGGTGGIGGIGGKGGKGYPGHRPISNKVEGVLGTDGGGGGMGGDGGRGGNAGQLTIVLANNLSGGLAHKAIGGAGSAGGQGGQGGQGGYEADNGNDGGAGSTGAKGSDYSPSVQTVSEEMFWTRVREYMGDTAEEWAGYRIRMGEYYFRAFRPTIPDLSNYLALAASEFMRALMLVPGNSKAQLLLDQINTNQNILGMPRDFDLVPDFERYQELVERDSQIVQDLFQTSLDLLLDASHVNGDDRRLTGQIGHINSSLDIFNKEKDAAELAKDSARANLVMADKRIEALKVEINANRAELEKHKLEVEDGKAWNLFLVIVAVVGTVYTSGLSLATLPGLLAKAQNTWTELEYDEKTKTATYRGKTILDWINWQDEKGNYNPKPKPEIEALIKGLTGVINNVGDIIKKEQLLSDIDKSTVDGQLNSQYKDLLKKSAELAFERADANLRLKQTELLLDAAVMRIPQANDDLKEIEKQKAELSGDIRKLAEINRKLVNGTQEYGNYIIKFIFWAVRSLEIYTLEDFSGEILYDYGYTHPDDEENAYLAMSRGDGSHIREFMNQYISSWSKLPKVITYRNKYETYNMGLGDDDQYWHFKDVAKLDQFRQKAEFDFSIALDEILPGRFETKVEAVCISLVGATANDPTITCILEHSGQASIKKRDGTIIQVMAPPKQTSVSATKDGTIEELNEESLLPFYWGKSPTAWWRLFIEPDVLNRSNINLSGLSEIQIKIKYRNIMGPV
jgi:hypothetical protein